MLPWHRPELKQWMIVGMNHYHMGAERWLYVSMIWRGVHCITAEGPDTSRLWDNLAEQSIKAIGPQK